MPTLTIAQIDAAIPPVADVGPPVAGVPSRALTNAALRALRADIQVVEDAHGATVVLRPDMSAAEVTAAIQTALDGGRKRVTVTGQGIFTLSDRLYCDDFTALKIDTGTTLRGPAALYHPTRMMGLIVNRNMLAPRSTVTMTSVSNVCTVGWPAHGKSVGDPIMLLGSITRGYNGVYHVASTPTADTLTVELEAVPAASPAVGVSWTGLQACAANQFIAVQIHGELNGNGANQPTPSGGGFTDRYLGGVFLSGVFRARVFGDGAVRDCKGYSVLVAGATHAQVDSLHINSVYRDGAHFQGPIRHLRVNDLSGYSFDDFTSLTTGDLESLELTEGEIEDAVIEKIDARCSPTGAIGAMFGKSVWWFGDVNYKDLRSKVQGQMVHPKLIGAGATRYELNQVRFVGKLTIDGLLWESSTQAFAQSAMVSLGSSCSMIDVDIKNLRMLGQATVNYGMAVNIGASGTAWSMRNLTIDGLYSTSQGSAFALIFGAFGNCTIDKLTLRNCSPTVPDGQSFFDLNGLVVNELIVDDFQGTLGNGSNMIKADNINGIVNHITVTRAAPTVVGYDAGNNWGELIFSNGAAIGGIKFIGCNSNAYRYVNSGGGMNVSRGHTITWIGCRRQNGKLWANLYRGCRMVMDANTEIGASGNVFWLRGTTPYHLHEGSLFSEVTTPIAFFDTATLNVYSPNRRLDITAPGSTGVNRVEGASCWNTNAALGTLGTAGPVVCLGTAANSWKRVGNNALTY
jgi:hypothetical protein